MTDLPLTGRARPDRRPHTLTEWRALGGYDAVDRALALPPAQVLDTVDAAALNGRGGAGFPAARKWRFMPAPEASPGPRYLIVNGDEMEPGAFKDRFLLEALPHQVIEGALIAAHATQATEAIILIRDDYRAAIDGLTRAVSEAQVAGYLETVQMRVHPSAGRYIVGEETALIAALEGGRAMPRKRPPFPAQSGLWGRPTTVNNVETISLIPHILANGAQWFRALSHTEEGGTKLYGLSGRVNRPGLFEAPMGTTARDLIQRAGGVSGSGRLLCFQPGGGASAFLGPEHLDVPMDFGHMAKAGSMLGTGTLIVLDDSACPVEVTARHMAFYARESCGWCVPCREGLPWAARILRALEDGTARPEDIAALRDIAAEASPRGRSFCDLMGGAMAPLASLLARFPDLIDTHLHRGCPHSSPHKGAA